MCGSRLYYIKAKFCFMDCLFDRIKNEVCGKFVIERSLYRCDNNVVLKRVPANTNQISKRDLSKMQHKGGLNEVTEQRIERRRRRQVKDGSLTVSEDHQEKTSLSSQSARCEKLIFKG